MPRDVATLWYKRTLYARSAFEMALKVAAWESYEKHTGNIKLVVRPLNYDLREQMFHRVIRVYTLCKPSELRAIADEIEQKVTAKCDGYGHEKE